MAQDTADIVGTTGAHFTITIDAASIPLDGAVLITNGQPDQSLPVAASGHAVTITSLPQGDSTVSLALIWAPGENQDATIDVETVVAGTVVAANPKHTIDLGDTPGYVELFGK